MSEKNARAFQILGLSGDSSQHEASSLEDEINLYYATHAKIGVDVLAFWQVSAYHLSMFIQKFILETIGLQSPVSNIVQVSYGYPSHPSFLCAL